MNKVHSAAGLPRRRRPGGRDRLRSLPASKNFLDLFEHRIRREISDNNQQRIRWHVMVAIEFLELLAAERSDLLLRRRDNGVRMRAEKHSAQSLAGEKSGRGALDLQ